MQDQPIWDFKAFAKGTVVKMSWEGDTKIGVNLDKTELTRPLAEAGTGVIARAIQAITATIKPSTKAYRESLRHGVEQGKAWALARYSGRTPGAAGTDALFNDSGNLVANLSPRPDGLGYMIATNLPGTRNRYVVVNRLRGLVPLLRSVPALKAAPEIKAALGDTLKVAIKRPLGKRAAQRASAFASRMASRVFGGR